MKVKVSELRQLIREEFQLKLPLKKARDLRRIVHFRYNIPDPLELREFERQLAKALVQELGISSIKARELIKQKQVIMPNWKAADGLSYAIQSVSDSTEIPVRLWSKWMPWPKRKR